MAEEKTVQASPPTRTNLLSQILERLCPKAAAQHKKDGTWPEGGAPYTIKNENGKVRILVTSDDGDVIAGNGPTVEKALIALKEKLA